MSFPSTVRALEGLNKPKGPVGVGGTARGLWAIANPANAKQISTSCLQQFIAASASTRHTGFHPRVYLGFIASLYWKVIIRSPGTTAPICQGLRTVDRLGTIKLETSDGVSFSFTKSKSKGLTSKFGKPGTLYPELGQALVMQISRAPRDYIEVTI